MTDNPTNFSQKHTILIAEDEKPMAKAMQIKLSHLGYQVDLAFSGTEALEACKRQRYDLILLDILMPEIDGFGVLESLKNNNYQTKIIITSNLSQTEDVAKAKNLGAIDFLVKSDTTLDEISERVAQALAE